VTSKLLKPFKIKNLKLQNRIMRSATWDATADEKGGITDLSVALYRELGEGNIGLIVTGYAYVSRPLGQAALGQYGNYSNRLIPGWKRIVRTVHDSGESKIAMQIVHAGFNSGYLIRQGKSVLAVSKLTEAKRAHREMTDGDIERIISDFGKAAKRVREAGFDAVQLHGAHGYLFSQFASPLFNHRIDQWGGSPENRRRFLIEVIREIKRVVGKDYPVFIKFGVQDDEEGGMSLAEGLETCRRMVDAGINCIEVSGGVGNPPFTIKEGESDKPAFRERAAEVKKAVSVPVAVVHGIRSLKMAEDIIDAGDADMVSMCRPFIREPHLIQRWQRGDTRPATCISCAKCSRLVGRGKPLECVEERRLRSHPLIPSPPYPVRGKLSTERGNSL
jgi:2,4-dienoyl-CoA reductase-like NADH-dependent reductase (Old Yellow Enzyme family)